MAQFPSTVNASGIWSLTDVRNNLMGSNWPTVAINLDYLIVAGGGGGGAAGGGAGGLLSGSTTLISGTTYSFTIGGGGTGQAMPQPMEPIAPDSHLLRLAEDMVVRKTEQTLLAGLAVVVGEVH